MADERFSGINRENAGVLHFLLTPLRMIMEIGKVVLFVSGLLFLLFYRQIGWIINVGPRSQSARQERAGLISAHLKHYNGEENDDGRDWAQYDVDFRTQPNPADDLESWNRFWPDDTLPWVEPSAWDSDVHDHRAKAFATTLDRAYGTGPHGIPHCVVQLNNGNGAGYIFDSSSGWDTEGNDALDRKASRMQRDYEVAAMMTSSLRYTLASLKLRRPLDVRPANYCDAAQGERSYSTRQSSGSGISASPTPMRTPTPTTLNVSRRSWASATSRTVTSRCCGAHHREGRPVCAKCAIDRQADGWSRRRPCWR